ncbi:hypothetical protein [Mycolicibacterium fluoranthenivorans]|uniref:Uncharacterized protein n=1 Tax=Mycolicibacterium fluoranthenivorans TaxID=258505 RepID=A0A7X5ZD63_9MYCO|nr:hypothetical protein [Mycolicibacterium fluoranthenivorans]MCV7358154.1 hypothetical protein [Mycolicibacterium fluoranthenivorans]NIH95725.1 hypothetical protein [Mycolicibacterium fluoranthenivorans]
MSDKWPDFDWPPVNNGGVVEFQVWGPNRDGGSTLTIAGPGLWRRPVVGTENGELIVQAEERFGSRPFTVSNYLVEVFGDELTEHIAQHSVSAPIRSVDGPLGEAPRIRKWGDLSQDF